MKGETEAAGIRIRLTPLPVTTTRMQFFTEAINVLSTLVIALGAGLAVWGVINLLEGYGNDNRATRS
jgi:hypothetical protein